MSHPVATQQLVNFIRKLTADGELSMEEAWLLADYLNQHEDAADLWPGNILVPAMQCVWADGEADAAELDALIRLLKDIEAEWTKHASRPAVTPSTKPPPPLPQQEAFRQSAALPNVAARVEVASSSGDDSYIVDLQRHTCTCPDFRKVRGGHPPGSLSRACKHMCQAFSDRRDEWPDTSPAIEAVIESSAEIGKGTPAGGRWQILAGGTVALCVNGQEWTNVYVAEPDGRFETYGYHVGEERWSYGCEPDDANTITLLIHNISEGG